MLFKILPHFLLLWTTIGGLSTPIMKEENNVIVDVANEDPELFPTATIPIHSFLRSIAVYAPSPTQPGLISTCDAFYFVESGDYCSGIVSRFGNFTLTQFYNWNPAVKSDCSNLLAGYYVCVGIKAATSVPSPTQTGIPSNCNEYYKVESGDTCVGISDSNNITLSNFYDWNPAVGSSCQTLIAGYYVCVGVSGEQRFLLLLERGNADDVLLLRQRDDSSSVTPTTIVTITVLSSTVTVTATATPL